MLFYVILIQSDIERSVNMKKTQLQGYRKNFIKFMSAFMVLFPWITYLNLSLLSEEESTVFAGYDGVLIDFFLKSKGIVLIWVVVLSVLWFVGERFLPQKVDNNVPFFKGKNKWLFILSGIFVVGTVFSTVFAKYQENAILGSPTVGEGVWMLLGYVVLILVFYNYFAHEYAIDKVKLAISILSGVAVILTMVEWFYKPLLEIGLVQALVAPAKYSQVVASMKALMFESAISLTFYNPGYFGGFVCILLPFVLCFFLQSKELKEKVIYAVLSAGLLFAVVTSNTTTAMYIAILEVAFMLIVYVFSNKIDKKFVLQTVGLAVSAVVMLVLAGVITGNSFLNVFSNANSATGTVVEERYEMKDIQMSGNRVTLVGEDTELTIVYENARVHFYDADGVILMPSYVDNNYVFEEPEYANLKVTVRGASKDMEDVQLALLVDAGYKSTIDFFVMKTGRLAGVGQNAMPIENISDAGVPEGLKQFYGAFTGRGYAWVNSLPILGETWLIGKGPGNFAYYFKQFDYVGLLETHKSAKQVIDKPHSAYIQYAIELGWPAAIAFFGIFLGTLLKAARLLIKNKKAVIESPVYIGAMASTAGFLVYSTINDSMITVTPTACMIAGVLLASCYNLEKK